MVLSKSLHMGWTLYQANFFIATKTTRYVVEKYSNDLVAKIPPQPLEIHTMPENGTNHMTDKNKWKRDKQ